MSAGDNPSAVMCNYRMRIAWLGSLPDDQVVAPGPDVTSGRSPVHLLTIQTTQLLVDYLKFWRIILPRYRVQDP